MSVSFTMTGPLSSRPLPVYMHGFKEPRVRLFYATDTKQMFSWNNSDDTWDSITEAGAGGGDISPQQFPQSVPATEWIVNHNLGYKPAAVEVLTPGGVDILADIVHMSVNQLRVYFSYAATGTVIIL